MLRKVIFCFLFLSLIPSFSFADDLDDSIEFADASSGALVSYEQFKEGVLSGLEDDKGVDGVLAWFDSRMAKHEDVDKEFYETVLVLKAILEEKKLKSADDFLLEIGCLISYLSSGLPGDIVKFGTLLRSKDVPWFHQKVFYGYGDVTDQDILKGRELFVGFQKKAGIEHDSISFAKAIILLNFADQLHWIIDKIKNLVITPDDPNIVLANNRLYEANSFENIAVGSFKLMFKKDFYLPGREVKIPELGFSFENDSCFQALAERLSVQNQGYSYGAYDWAANNLYYLDEEAKKYSSYYDWFRSQESYVQIGAVATVAVVAVLSSYHAVKYFTKKDAKSSKKSKRRKKKHKGKKKGNGGSPSGGGRPPSPPPSSSPPPPRLPPPSPKQIALKKKLSKIMRARRGKEEGDVARLCREAQDLIDAYGDVSGYTPSKVRKILEGL